MKPTDRLHRLATRLAILPFRKGGKVRLPLSEIGARCERYRLTIEEGPPRQNVTIEVGEVGLRLFCPGAAALPRQGGGGAVGTDQRNPQRAANCRVDLS
jgi:hypothetical protein